MNLIEPLLVCSEFFYHYVSITVVLCSRESYREYLISVHGIYIDKLKFQSVPKLSSAWLTYKNERIE